LKLRYIENVKRSDSIRPLKMVHAGIQLYEHYNPDTVTHVLDIHKLSGNVYVFMDLSALVLSRLERSLVSA